jgi:hypothetical protein
MASHALKERYEVQRQLGERAGQQTLLAAEQVAVN